MDAGNHTSGERRDRPVTFRRWLESTSNRTFIVYPLCVIAFELAVTGGSLTFVPLGIPLLAWGYAQYHLVGRYRTKLGGGGPGLEVPPDRIVEQGPYRYVRNPMYLGHLIFMLGLAVTFWSLAALALLVFHIFWFHQRVLKDEARLEARFGQSYADYKARVKRWIPGVI
ncbi:MAG TPA: isoprenylcysteine carboxylmethyltransferase family protein [Hyphomicrobiaceae bacterium]|nr:isoprenylcysteine carboxylmethyltransferase family protein [Hyphomicrobiaceae bacterium]